MFLNSNNQCGASRGAVLRVGNNSLNVSILEFKIHTFVQGFLSRLNLYNLKSLQLILQAAEFKLESKFEQLQVTWQSMKLFGECFLDCLGTSDSRDSGTCQHKHKVFQLSGSSCRQ